MSQSRAQAIHTPFSRGLVMLALGTGATALALGNPVLLIFAGTIAAFLHAARAGWPGSGEVIVEPSATRVQRGQSVQFRVVARTGSAPYAYWLHQPLPAAFTLERASNVGIVGPAVSTEVRFDAGCPKRGLFQLAPATLTALHPHMLAPAAPMAASQPLEMLVEPRVKTLRKAKHIRGRARVLLGEDRTRRGQRGSDFREVREYHRGDPLKAVNWKATAKRSLGRELNLMVNDFEPEARKDIWFFLDLGAEMEVGTSLDNAFEDAIECTLALVHHFVSRGHRVGGTTFNAPPLLFYADSGTRQHLTIARALAQAEPGTLQEGLPAAVERVKGFLSREKPTVFVITRPDLDPEGLLQGARRIQQHATGRKPQPVYVLAPEAGAASPAEDLARTLRDLEGTTGVRSSGRVRIVRLREGVASLDAALAKGVLAR